MSDSIRPNTDSRESFTESEYNAYFDATEIPMYYDDVTECEYEFDGDECDPSGWYEDDYEDDHQPDEYTEWQDYMGGDDWDHGQYDEW